MKYHVLTMTHMFDMRDGRYSILSNSAGDLLFWIMEREWVFNRRSVSCVPRDEYVLEPHDGEKYVGTYALVGDGVGHTALEGKPRYACVIHRATFPSQLEGCLTPCKSIGVTGFAVEAEEATRGLLSYLDHHTKQDQRVKILMQ